MSGITLDQANSIIAGALNKGREMGLKPLSAAMLDAGGRAPGWRAADVGGEIKKQVLRMAEQSRDRII